MLKQNTLHPFPPSPPPSPTKKVKIIKKQKQKKKMDFEANFRGVNSVLVKKLHDFEITCPTKWILNQHQSPPLQKCIRALACIANYMLSTMSVDDHF